VQNFDPASNVTGTHTHIEPLRVRRTALNDGNVPRLQYKRDSLPCHRTQSALHIAFAPEIFEQRHCRLTLEITGAHEVSARSARTHLCVRVD
jgi:hypothetical protein